MASITIYGGTAANLRSLFHGRKFLKLLKRRTVGQAVPKIPLSVGSKLELLLRAFVFANFFRILPRTLCPRMHINIAVYIHVYTCTVFPRIEAGVSISFLGFLTRPLNEAGLYSREASNSRMRRAPISKYARLRHARILSASTPYSLVAAFIVALSAWLTDRNLQRKGRS